MTTILETIFLGPRVEFVVGDPARDDRMRRRHQRTDGPAPTLPNDFIRLFIVSAKAAKDFSTKETANEGFNSGKAAIGTGPYRFVSWTPKDQLVLERFDGYWGGKEPWQRVLRKEIPNDTARVAQLKAGQLDLIARAPAADVPTLEKDSKLTVVKIDTVYDFNMEILPIPRASRSSIASAARSWRWRVPGT